MKIKTLLSNVVIKKWKAAMVFMYLQVDNMEIDFLFEIDNLDLRGYS